MAVVLSTRLWVMGVGGQQLTVGKSTRLYDPFYQYLFQLVLIARPSVAALVLQILL